MSTLTGPTVGVPPGAEGPDRRPGRIRTIAAAAAGLTLAAAVLAGWYLADRTTTRTQTTVRHLDSPRSVAASDCPLGESCSAGIPRSATVIAVRSHFPGAVLLDGWTTASPRSGVVAEHVVVRTRDGIVLTETARCVAGGVPVPDAPVASRPARGPALLSTVAAGRTGCSVGLIADVPAGVAVPFAQLEALATDARLPLS